MPSFARLVLLVSVAASVSAQDAVGDEAPRSIAVADPAVAATADSVRIVGDTTEVSVAAAVRADSSRADSVKTPSLSGLLRRVAATARAAQAPPQPGALVGDAFGQATSPTQHVFGSGVVVTLPTGWDGPSAIDERPGYALYTFRNATPGHLLAGAMLRVERLDDLDPLEQERWQRGQVPNGYHGTRPVGPISVPATGLALEVADGARGGAVVFSRDRNVGWAVQVLAPTAVWQARRGELLALLAAVDLP